ncbi:RibD family protein [Henriciella sp. AS95]|uniref:RibD family protein n=1 Tax=Henriciella sp. AS95 TaxID=3135782 RepID=UPI00317B05E8
MSARASVTLKIATSMDGRIALANGTSQWITNSQSRARSHQMRAEHDAVLVGIGTVLADDPLLTARIVPLPERQPVRIVADSRLRTPVTSRLVQSASAGRVVLAHAASNTSSASVLRDVDHWAVGDGNGRVAPAELVRRARAEGIDSIFLEGGGTLAASFLREGLVDRICWFRAPIIIGGDGIAAIGPLALETMANTSRWTLAERELISGDSLEIWEPLKD